MSIKESWTRCSYRKLFGDPFLIGQIYSTSIKYGHDVFLPFHFSPKYSLDFMDLRYLWYIQLPSFSLWTFGKTEEIDFRFLNWWTFHILFISSYEWYSFFLLCMVLVSSVPSTAKQMVLTCPFRSHVRYRRSEFTCT